MNNIINKMTKQNRDKILAKIIWNTMVFITIVSAVGILAIGCTAIEEMMLTFPRILAITICSGWIALFALFITWIETVD